MPKAGVETGVHGEEIDYYEIAARQFQQQILPASDGFGPTTVWSYGSAAQGHPNTFNYPAYTIEVLVNRPIRVKWINDLKDEYGHYLPHLLPVDQTLHWANPPGGMMRDHRSMDPTPYTGPVPLVTHVHGAHTVEDSDGYPEAWYLPDANDIPAGYARTGTYYDIYRPTAEARQGKAWEAGSAVFDYRNDQRAGTNWYHDHALGMTRSNVYAGPAGFYILRGGSSDLQDGSLPAGDYEIPVVIQDRSFNVTGNGPQTPSLFYPNSREFFDQYTGPFIPDPDSDISPIWNPEFFGNVMVVNGRSWPQLTVERKRYRLRFLNGCNSRFLILRMTSDDPSGPEFHYPAPDHAALPFWQIGAEGGFLDAPAELDFLLMSPAERADVIIDFSKVPNDVNAIYLINEAPDEPYGGGRPGVEFSRADLQTTGQVMKFILTPAVGADSTVDPATTPLALPVRQKLGTPNKIRKVALLEMDSEKVWVGGEPAGPREAVLGVVDHNIFGNPIFFEKSWMDQVTETPLAGDVEMWEIYNTTMDAHPIHLHLVMFEVMNRENRGNGIIELPRPGEIGLKDTVIAYPGEITRIKARFDLPGLYVWHCHIVEHEDNEMMRPYRVLHRINMPIINR